MKAKILTLALVISASMVFAQSGSIIIPAQRTDGSMIVDITYDLAGTEPDYTISVEASFDDGVTFTQIDSVSGDVGAGIVPGTGKAIVWNFGNEFTDQYSSTTQIKLTASPVAPWNCGDPLVDDRDGQSYNTVQIGTQCWMAENLNIGTMINGSSSQTDNSIIEKYCYDNNTSNCDTYGGLYQWNEMMQYTTTPGVQGICPAGWHLPTDAEWCTLENEVDAGTVSCTATGWRGIDAGLNLKSTSGWYLGGNGTDLYGFTALPGGARDTDGSFGGLATNAYFWSSDESGSYAWLRRLYYSTDGVYRDSYYKSSGFNVRCLKD